MAPFLSILVFVLAVVGATLAGRRRRARERAAAAATLAALRAARRQLFAALPKAARDPRAGHPDGWLARSAWAPRWQPPARPPAAVLDAHRARLPAAARRRFDRARAACADPAAAVARHNRRWLAAATAAHAGWLDGVLSHPLHEDQRRAVLVDADAHLVIAGAGTGKTATLVARVAWLVERRGVAPGEILLMAYNRKARDELAGRLAARGITGVAVQTFHGLGYQLVAELRGGRPPVSGLAQDDAARGRFVAGALRALATPADGRRALLRWFSAPAAAAPGAPLATLGGGSTPDAALAGAANWLALHGIPATPDPDGGALWLPGPRLRLALDGIDPARRGGAARLERAVVALGLAPALGDGPALQRCLDAPAAAPAVAAAERLVGAALLALRTAGAAPAEVAARLASPRARRLLALVGPVAAAWRAQLADRGEVDFDDMLAEATAGLEAGALAPPWRHVLVDELQDASPARIALVAALVAAAPGARFVGVGDDWQAIYGFAGAAPAALAATAAALGPHETTVLRQTWRLPADLLAVSSAVAMADPALGRRRLLPRPGTEAGPPGVVLWLHGPGEAAARDAATAAVARIAARSPGATLLVLARTHRGLAGPAAQAARAAAADRGLALAAHTIHRAKGLEADHVLVLDLHRGRGGLPAAVPEDPALADLRAAVAPAAPAAAPPVAHAEERRLFHVALTRAREAAWLVVPADRPSPFVAELRERHREDGLLHVIGAENDPRPCPRCGTGWLVQRQSAQGPFVGCSRWAPGGTGCGHRQDGRL